MVMCFMLFMTGMCIPQDSLYILNPVIGEIIDRNEKTVYDLFPEIPNSKFEYSYVQKTGGTFWLKSHLYPDSVAIRQLDTSEIHRVERKIALVLDSNPNLKMPGAKPGELKSIVIKPAETEQTNSKIMYPATLESITNEIIVDERLKDDAEMFRLWKQGSNIDNAGMYIDFSYRKKKKK